MTDLEFLNHMQSENIADVAEALKNARAEMEAARKDTSARNYNYATIDQIIKLSKAPLANNNLEITQTTLPYNGAVLLVTQVTHTKSGQFKRGFLPITVPDPILNSKGAEVGNAAQRFGSGMTYARRYAFAAILSIPQEDNDGLPCHWQQLEAIENEKRQLEIEKQRKELELKKQEEHSKAVFQKALEKAGKILAECKDLDTLGDAMNKIMVACEKQPKYFKDLTPFETLYEEQVARIKNNQGA